MKPTRAALERRLNALEVRALPKDGPHLELVLNHDDGTQTVLILGADAKPAKSRKTVLASG